MGQFSAGANTGRHWRIHHHDGRTVEVIFSDDLTRSEVLAIRPGATDAEPIAPAHRSATEDVELRRLVGAVLADPAHRDIASALICYRLLAAAARGRRSP